MSGRLLVVSGFWPTESNGISGIFVTQQAKALIRAGLSLDVVVPRAIGRSGAQLVGPASLGLDPKKCRLIETNFLKVPDSLSGYPPMHRVNAWCVGQVLARIVKAACREGVDYEACIIHGMRYVALALPCWRRLIGGRVAIVVHGVDPVLAREPGSHQVRALCKAAEQSADVIAPVGRPLLPHLRMLGFSDAKVGVVPNGTELPPVPAASAYDSLPAEGQCTITSVSNLISLKGIADNIVALSALRDRRPELAWEYRVVGDGPERNSFEALARDLGLAGRVRFLGRLDYAATMAEVSRCDIFSLPSWGEAFGIVYLEAMARGKPAIGCLDNGAADIITNGHDGVLVPPRSPKYVSAELERLMYDAKLRASIGAHARVTAQSFSWDANAARMIDLLLEAPHDG